MNTAIACAVLRQATRARGRDTSGTFRLLLVGVADDNGSPRIAHLQLSGPLVAEDETPRFARPLEADGRPDA